MINNSPLSRAEAILIPSPSLAYLGDAMYELLVRERMVLEGSRSPSVDALKYVPAPAQSQAVEKILPILTEEEEGVYRRGRNSVKSGFPKHASPSEYKKATGLEALFGYLYLTGNEDRARALFNAAFE